jgi:hypothetical protein
MPEFFYPRSIVQYAEYPETHISWTNDQSDHTIVDNPNYNLNNPTNGSGSYNVIGTTKPLTHVANPTRGPKLDKTYYLKCTNFNIGNLPNTITGITLHISSQRNQKIIDETVCLIYDGEIISDNKTNLSAGHYGVEGHMKIENEASYGGPEDLWGATITKTMLQDSKFGVLLRFSSNPMRPHKEGMTIYQIVLEVGPNNYFVFEENFDTEFVTEDAINELIFVNE